jgi:predicted dehydrogenase
LQRAWDLDNHNTEAMKEIGWGIVGLGNIAHSFAADFQFSTGGKLVAAASRSLSSAQSFCQNTA